MARWGDGAARSRERGTAAVWEMVTFKGRIGRQAAPRQDSETVIVRQRRT